MESARSVRSRTSGRSSRTTSIGNEDEVEIGIEDAEPYRGPLEVVPDDVALEDGDEDEDEDEAASGIGGLVAFEDDAEAEPDDVFDPWAAHRAAERAVDREIENGDDIEELAPEELAIEDLDAIDLDVEDDSDGRGLCAAPRCRCRRCRGTIDGRGRRRGDARGRARADRFRIGARTRIHPRRDRQARRLPARRRRAGGWTIRRRGCNSGRPIGARRRTRTRTRMLLRLAWRMRKRTPRDDGQDPGDEGSAFAHDGRSAYRLQEDDSQAIVEVARLPEIPSPRIALAGGGNRETRLGETEEETGEVPAAHPIQPESHTSEVSVVPRGGELDDEDDSGPVPGGFSVSFERPQGAADSEDEDDEAGAEAEPGSHTPRLTDDEPVQDVARLDPSLELNAIPAVDEGRLAAFLQAAQESEASGDLHNAIVRYSDAMDLAPDRTAACLGRGRAYLELGDYAAAMSDFQRAEDLAPGSPEPLTEMGNLYFARKEYRRSIDFYDQALDLEPGMAMPRCRRGMCHYYLHNHKSAFQDLQKAYSLDPEIPNIRKYVQMAVKAMERDHGARR